MITPLVKAGTPLHGPNLFPSNIPEFREIVLDYMAAMTKVGHCLVAGISLSLGLEESYFADRYTLDPLILFRIFQLSFAFTKLREMDQSWESESTPTTDC